MDLFVHVACRLCCKVQNMVLTVRESQGKSKYKGAKVNKNAEKNLNCCTHTVYNGSKFVLLASLADYLYVRF